MARLIFGLAALACFMVCAHGDAAYGYGHYHYAKTTCADHYKPGVKNGFYKVYSTKHYGAIKVYCDFETEPGNAYTLIISSSASNRGSNFVMPGAALSDADPFVGLSLVKLDTSHDAFSLQRDGVNGNSPNNDSYRLPQADIEKISKASSVWRKTFSSEPVGSAAFNQEMLFNRYVRVAMTEVNPTTFTDATAYTCTTKAEFINGGHAVNPTTPPHQEDGRTCANCEVGFKQGPYTTVHATDDNSFASCVAGNENWKEQTTGDPGNPPVEYNYIQFWFGKSV